jgi:hypothetical protein
MFEHATKPDFEFGNPTVDVGRGNVGVPFPELRSYF